MPLLLLIIPILLQQPIRPTTSINCSYTVVLHSDSQAITPNRPDSWCRAKLSGGCDPKLIRVEKDDCGGLEFATESQADFCWIKPLRIGSWTKCATTLSAESNTKSFRLKFEPIDPATNRTSLKLTKTCVISSLTTPFSPVKSCETQLNPNYSFIYELREYNRFFGVDKLTGQLFVVRPLFHAKSPVYLEVNVHLSDQKRRFLSGQYARLSISLRIDHNQPVFRIDQNRLSTNYYAFESLNLFGSAAKIAKLSPISPTEWEIKCSTTKKSVGRWINSGVSACCLHQCYPFEFSRIAKSNPVVEIESNDWGIYTKTPFIRLGDFVVVEAISDEIGIDRQTGKILVKNPTIRNQMANISFSVFYFDQFLRFQNESVRISSDYYYNKTIGPIGEDDNDWVKNSDEKSNLLDYMRNRKKSIKLINPVRNELIDRIDDVLPNSFNLSFRKNDGNQNGICLDESGGFIFVCSSTPRPRSLFNVTVHDFTGRKLGAVEVDIEISKEKEKKTANTPDRQFIQISNIRFHSPDPVFLLNTNRSISPDLRNVLVYDPLKIVGYNQGNLSLHRSLEPSSTHEFSICFDLLPIAVYSDFRHLKPEFRSCILIAISSTQPKFIFPECTRKLTRVVAMSPPLKRPTNTSSQLVRLDLGDYERNVRFSISRNADSSIPFAVESLTGIIKSKPWRNPLKLLPQTITLHVDVQSPTGLSSKCVVRYEVCRPRSLFPKLKFFAEPNVDTRVRIPIISDCQTQYFSFQFAIVNVLHVLGSSNSTNKVSIHKSTGAVSVHNKNGAVGSLQMTVLVAVAPKKISEFADVKFADSGPRKLRIQVGLEFIDRKSIEVYRRFTQMDLPHTQKPGSLLIKFNPTLAMDKPMFALGGLNASLFYIDPDNGDLFLVEHVRKIPRIDEFASSSFNVIIFDAHKGQSEYIEVVVFVIDDDDSNADGVDNLSGIRNRTFNLDIGENQDGIISDLRAGASIDPQTTMELVDVSPSFGLNLFSLKSGVLISTAPFDPIWMPSKYELAIRADSPKESNPPQFATIKVNLISRRTLGHSYLFPRIIEIPRGSQRNDVCVASIGEIGLSSTNDDDLIKFDVDGVWTELWNDQLLICVNPQLAIDDVVFAITKNAEHEIGISRNREEDQTIYDIFLDWNYPSLISNLSRQLIEQRIEQDDGRMIDWIQSGIIDKLFGPNGFPGNYFTAQSGNNRRQFAYVHLKKKFVDLSPKTFAIERMSLFAENLTIKIVAEDLIKPKTVYLPAYNSSFKFTKARFLENIANPMSTSKGISFTVVNPSIKQARMEYLAKTDSLRPKTIAGSIRIEIVSNLSFSKEEITLRSLSRDQPIHRIDLVGGETISMGDSCGIEVNPVSGYCFLKPSGETNPNCGGLILRNGRALRSLQLRIAIPGDFEVYGAQTRLFHSFYYLVNVYGGARKVFNAREALKDSGSDQIRFRLKCSRAEICGDYFTIDSESGIISTRTNLLPEEYWLIVEAYEPRGLSSSAHLVVCTGSIGANNGISLKKLARKSITVDYGLVGHFDYFYVPLLHESFERNGLVAVEKSPDWVEVVDDAVIAIKTRLVKPQEVVKTDKIRICSNDSECESIRLSVVVSDDKNPPEFLDQQRLDEEKWCQRFPCYAASAYDPDGGSVSYRLENHDLSNLVSVDSETGEISVGKSGGSENVANVIVRAIDGANRSAVSGVHRIILDEKWCGEYHLPAFRFNLFTKHTPLRMTLLKIPLKHGDDLVLNTQTGGRAFSSGINDNFLTVKWKDLIADSSPVFGWHNFTLSLSKKNCPQHSVDLFINVQVSDSSNTLRRHRRNHLLPLESSRWCSKTLGQTQVSCYSTRQPNRKFNRVCFVESASLSSRQLRDFDRSECCAKFTRKSDSVWIKEDLKPGGIYGLAMTDDECCGGESGRFQPKIDYNQSSAFVDRMFEIKNRIVSTKTKLKVGTYRLVISDGCTQMLLEVNAVDVNNHAVSFAKPANSSNEITINYDYCLVGTPIFEFETIDKDNSAGPILFLRGSEMFRFDGNRLMCKNQIRLLVPGRFNLTIYAFDGVYTAKTHLTLNINQISENVICDDQKTIHSRVQHKSQLPSALFNLTDFYRSFANRNNSVNLEIIGETKDLFYIDGSQSRVLWLLKRPSPNTNILRITVKVASKCFIRFVVALDFGDQHPPQIGFNQTSIMFDSLKSQKRYFLTDLSVVDNDLPAENRNSIIYYELCSNSTSISIDQNTGEVFAQKTNISDSEVCVRACDHGQLCDQRKFNVSVTIIDFGDFLNDYGSIEIDEHVRIHTRVFSLPDEIAKIALKHNYELTAKSEVFYVSNYSIFVGAELDRESVESHSLNLCLSEVSCGILRIRLIDQNDNFPLFSNLSSKQCDCTTNNTFLSPCKIIAIDDDESENGKLIYSNTNPKDEYIEIDGETGEIRCKPMDFEYSQLVSYKANLSACDGGEEMKCSYWSVSMSVRKEQIICRHHEFVLLEKVTTTTPIHEICLQRQVPIKIMATKPPHLLEFVEIRNSSIYLLKWFCCLPQFELYIATTGENRAAKTENAVIKFGVSADAFANEIRFNQKITAYHSAKCLNRSFVGMATTLFEHLICPLNHSLAISHPDFYLEQTSGHIRYNYRSDSPRRIATGLVVAAEPICPGFYPFPTLRALIQLKIENTVQIVETSNFTIFSVDQSQLDQINQTQYLTIGVQPNASGNSILIASSETVENLESVGNSQTHHLIVHESNPFWFNCCTSQAGLSCQTLQVLELYQKRNFTSPCYGISNSILRQERDTDNILKLTASDYGHQIASALNHGMRLEMSFKTKSSDGSIVYVSDSRILRFMVKIEWNVARLLVNCRSRIVRQTLEAVRISDGFWHDLWVDYKNPEVHVWIDGRFHVSYKCDDPIFGGGPGIDDSVMSIGGFRKERIKIFGIDGWVANVTVDGETVGMDDIGDDDNDFSEAFEEPCDACTRDPCVNSGQCVQFGDYRKCICTPRFMGLSCEIDQAPCLANPCSKQRNCLQINRNFVASFICVRQDEPFENRSMYEKSLYEDGQLMTMFISGILITTLLFLFSIVIIISSTNSFVCSCFTKILMIGRVFGRDQRKFSCGDEFEKSPVSSNTGDLRPLMSSTHVFVAAGSISPENEYFLPHSIGQLKTLSVYDRFTRLTKSEQNSWRINPRRLDSVKRHRDASA